MNLSEGSLIESVNISIQDASSGGILGHDDLFVCLAYFYFNKVALLNMTYV